MGDGYVDLWIGFYSASNIPVFMQSFTLLLGIKYGCGVWNKRGVVNFISFISYFIDRKSPKISEMFDFLYRRNW